MVDPLLVEGLGDWVSCNGNVLTGIPGDLYTLGVTGVPIVEEIGDGVGYGIGGCDILMTFPI